MKTIKNKKAPPIKTLTVLLNTLHDEEDCRRYLEEVIGLRCVYCYQEKITERLDKNGDFVGYKCLSCNNFFNIFTGTEFENSSVPFRKWLIAIFLYRCSTDRKISSHELGKDIGVTQKTAYRMLLKIRAVDNDDYRAQMVKKRRDQYNKKRDSYDFDDNDI